MLVHTIFSCEKVFCATHYCRVVGGDLEALTNVCQEKAVLDAHRVRLES